MSPAPSSHWPPRAFGVGAFGCSQLWVSEEEEEAGQAGSGCLATAAGAVLGLGSGACGVTLRDPRCHELGRE